MPAPASLVLLLHPVLAAPTISSQSPRSWRAGACCASPARRRRSTATNRRFWIEDDLADSEAARVTAGSSADTSSLTPGRLARAAVCRRAQGSRAQPLPVEHGARGVGDD